MRLSATSIAAGCCIGVAAATKPLVNSADFRAAIKQKGLMDNLRTLNTIANDNGGNRAFGFPGFDASVDFVASRLAELGGFTSWTQSFPANFSEVQSIDFTVGDTSYYIVGLTYSPSTSEEGITRQLVHGPTGPDGCNAAGYEGLDVDDKIVLVQRGTCPTGGTLAGRVRPAAAAGAAAVVIYNDVETNVTGGTLSAPDPDAFVPAGFINRVDGLALVERLEGGENIDAHFQQTQEITEMMTRNVFAETKGGDADNVVMLGAHLDSVQAGPGINDDGSGSSLLLELSTALNKFRVNNKVRFAWWGAEENGLVGSKFYTANLGEKNVSSLLAYLNFDMVSSGYYGVFDGDGSTHGLAGAPGSDVIERLFTRYFERQGIEVTPAVFTGGSDYASFMDTLDKPVGGLHTGTGFEQDPCYHQACDNIDNPKPGQLTDNAKAAAHVLTKLAVNGTDLIPKQSTNRGLAILSSDEMFPWTYADGERHLATCGHDV